MHLINVLHSSWRICYPPMLSIRVCNPKEPRTVSCRTLRERSLHNMPCPLYSTVVFNLITLFFNSFCSLSFMYFLYRQNQRSAPERAKAKVPKSSAQSKKLPSAKLGYTRCKNISKLCFNSFAQAFTNALCSGHIM